MMLSTTSGKDSTGGRYSIREGQNSASGGLRRFAAGSWRMDRRIRAASFPVAHENVSYGSWLCKNATTRKQASPISIGLRKIILFTFQFSAFLHRLGLLPKLWAVRDICRHGRPFGFAPTVDKRARKTFRNLAIVPTFHVK